MNQKTYPVPSPLGGSRGGMLRAIRQALGGRTIQTPSAPEIDDVLVRLAGPEDDLLSVFATGAEAVGMEVHRIKNDALAGKLQELVRKHAARTCVVGLGDETANQDIRDILKFEGVAVVDWKGEGGTDAQFDVDLAVTDVHAALAETGTLVCCSDAAHGRCLSLVPPVHVAVVRPGDLLPDMIDFWSQCDPGQLPSSISFITGPSKTADIEGILVTGVHGPGTVHIILLDA